MSISLKQTSPNAFVQIQTQTTQNIVGIWRSDRNGTLLVRDSDTGLKSGANIINDYEASFGKNTYLMKLADGTIEQATILIPLGKPVIINIFDPSDNQSLEAITGYTYQRQSGSIVHETLGASQPVITLKQVGLKQATLTIEADAHAHIHALEELLSRAYIFRLKIPEHDTLDLYFAVQTISVNPIDNTGSLGWEISLEVIETGWQTGGIEKESFNTYEDGLEKHSYYSDAYLEQMTYLERYKIA